MDDRLKTIAAVIPPAWRQGRGYWRWRRFLNDAQHWPRERIERWQLQKLQAIVRFAYENTEGYRELYRKAGVGPDDLRSLRDIQRLPFTTKLLFQDNLEAFSIRNNARKYVTTGGSTGIPFGFYVTRRQITIEAAFMHTDWTRAGWWLGMRSAILRGGFVGSAKKLWDYDTFRRELNLSSYQLTETTLPRYLEALERWNIKVLQAYPSSLNLLCDLLPEPLSLELVLLGSENIYDWELEKFPRVLPHARFHGWYGHAEMAIYAPWCEHQRKFHLWPYYGFTEVLRDDNSPTPAGEEGELVGTSFHNFTTPLIRYRTMDRATVGAATCAGCGRAFQLLDRIAGRSHEVIVTGTGRYISMTAINMHDPIFDPVRQFQFLQEKPGHVIFRYVPKQPLSTAQMETIRQGLMHKLGHDMELSLVSVDHIDRTRAGKFRFLDQRLTIKYGDR